MKKILLALAALATVAGPVSAGTRKIFIAGYSVPGEAVEQAVAPAFARRWAAAHGGERIQFQYSWSGSSAQAQAVAAGLEADVVYLSEASDVEKIREAGLITRDWNAGGRGIVSRSVVVFRVAPGNPLAVRDWQDLLKPGVRVLTPNPRTSGGARWNILAAYGQVTRRGGAPAAAEQYLRALYRQTAAFAPNARTSIQEFERGVGNVAITYENEVLLQRRRGREVAFVIPPSTILIENPAAVVDAYADRHGVKDVADAFVAFLRSGEAQGILAEYGFRSVDPAVAGRFASRFPAIAHEFDVSYFGGWPSATTQFFARGATSLWDRIIRTERRERR